jgi:diguanylate cyclase (GGDEF)-like protein
MTATSILSDEIDRLCALNRYNLTRGDASHRFEPIVGRVRAAFDAPVAMVSLIDADRQRFLASSGFDATDTPRSMAFCHYTIQSRSVLSVPDATRDPRFRHNPLVLGSPFIRSYHGAPLESPEGHNLGALCLIDVKPRSLTAGETELLRGFASLVVAEIELRQINRVDHLSGVMSRDALIEAIRTEMLRCRRTFTVSSLALLDLDDAAILNATGGLAAGDCAILRTAEAAKRLLRAYDLIGRIEGDRFALLMPGAETQGAVAAMDRLCKVIESVRIDHRPDLRITASIGTSAYREDLDAPEDWLAASDAMLRNAKAAGKNRCVG